jgi:hypothetical protein
MLAGTHMLDGSNGFKESKLQEVTNLNDFYSSLPFGAATVVGSKKEGEGYTLSSGNYVLINCHGRIYFQVQF